MKYYLLLFTILFVQSIQAQDTTEETENYVNESAALNPGNISKQKGFDEVPIEIQRFDPAKWKKVIGNEDFEEIQSTKPKEDKAKGGNDENGDRRINKNDNDDSGASSNISISSTLLTVLVYAAAIGIIGYILFLIVENSSWRSNKKIRKSDIHNDLSSPAFEIKELEIDKLLREAMDSGNYRLAIRICFLGLLKKLDEDSFIIWKKDKTNRDYLSELYLKARYYEEVKKLTSAYELVWYGDHDLEVQYYEEIISSFKAMNQNLNTSNAQ